MIYNLSNPYEREKLIAWVERMIEKGEVIEAKKEGRSEDDQAEQLSPSDHLLFRLPVRMRSGRGQDRLLQASLQQGSFRARAHEQAWRGEDLPSLVCGSHEGGNDAQYRPIQVLERISGGHLPPLPGGRGNADLRHARDRAEQGVHIT